MDVTVGTGSGATGGSGIAVGALTGDGQVVQVTLPTTPQQTQEALAPVGSLAGALLGDQVGSTVTQLTDGLAPAVAGVTATVDGVAQPLLGTVDAVLAPVVGDGGVLAPVTGQLGTLVDGLTGRLSGGGSSPAPGYTGPLVAADLGNTVLTGPGSTGTIAGVNVLAENPGLVSGQLVTADLLADGNVLDLTVPTTAAGVAQGLAPAGNLAGAVLGAQVGEGVTQLTDGLAPVVAPVTSTVDAVVSPVLDAVNGALAPVTGAIPLGTGDAGSTLAPVTGVVGGLLGGSSGSAPGNGSVLAPLTGLLGRGPGTGN
ncbi:hypothetical protein [Novosphingobium soli]|uniref:Collagen-like protein n=1 Tax=Novosphingobium soli TaxID=574956 RepID=A0ABV6CVC6_9SPHN